MPYSIKLETSNGRCIMRPGMTPCSIFFLPLPVGGSIRPPTGYGNSAARCQSAAAGAADAKAASTASAVWSNPMGVILTAPSAQRRDVTVGRHFAGAMAKGEPEIIIFTQVGAPLDIDAGDPPPPLARQFDPNHRLGRDRRHVDVEKTVVEMVRVVEHLGHRARHHAAAVAQGTSLRSR